MIILEKNIEKKKLSKRIADTTTLAEVFQVLRFDNFAERYKWAINNADLDKAKDLGLTNIKKY